MQTAVASACTDRLLRTLVVLLPAAGLAWPWTVRAAGTAPEVVVEVEEEVYRYENPDNGAGPSWCYGNTCIVRSGPGVFVSGIEKIPDVRPLNNTRWLLYVRSDEGWRPVQKDPRDRTREPSPLGILPDGSVLMSVNPTLTPPDASAGPAQPQILRFDARRPEAPFETILPVWEGNPDFTEHSYRSFAVDGVRGELILFQNVAYSHSAWAFRDGQGRWSARGRLTWPWGADYQTPQPIRVCYPSVQLRDRAVYFCGVSDILEPNEAWRAYKRELTGRDWDYDFRRLFYTWTPDITGQEFRPWVELASRERTCGWITPCDLWVDDGGTVHVLWTERAIDPRLREKFFPGEKQSESLHYARVREGRIVSRCAILHAEEGDASAPLPGRARFHVMPDGRLLVFLHARVPGSGGQAADENRLLEIQEDGTPGPFVRVPLKTPMTAFFTAGVRAGCRPCDTIDLLADTGQAMRYARVRVGR